MNPTRVPVRLGPVTVGDGAPCVIAGLCVLEQLEQTLDLAGELAEVCRRRGLGFVFKGSFDKANRTSLSSYRGPGIEAGLEMLAAVRSSLGVPVLTDVHAVGQVEAVARVVDALQVPAFLCRQTDLLLACGRTGKPVNLKKGQFLVPGDMRYAAEKVQSVGGQVLLTERGTAFGYGDLVVDMRSLIWLREIGCPVIFDGTHSVQRPGAGGQTAGLREMVAPLVRAAVAVGIDGLYLEVHPEPDRARCDAANCLSVARFAELLEQVERLWASGSRTA